MIKKIVCSVLLFFVFASVISADSLSPFDKILIEVTNNIAASDAISANSQIAVVGFRETPSKKRLQLSSIVENDLSTMLINKMPGRIIVKNHIDTVLKELKITNDDIFDANNRKQLGKLLSADLIVTGNYWINNKDININITIINIESGLALFSDKKIIKKSSFSEELLKTAGELGNMYYQGKAVKQDYKQALMYYQIGAEYGESSAQNGLGLMCD
ncbi:MAG: hypothetical protein LBT79_07515, partial [Elusimicrobiota bacterium]|nr:hypothetical protein [Elusimicrobiota bacterium]